MTDNPFPALTAAVQAATQQLNATNAQTLEAVAVARQAVEIVRERQAREAALAEHEAQFRGQVLELARALRARCEVPFVEQDLREGLRTFAELVPKVAPQTADAARALVVACYAEAAPAELAARAEDVVLELEGRPRTQDPRARALVAALLAKWELMLPALEAALASRDAEGAFVALGLLEVVLDRQSLTPRQRAILLPWSPLATKVPAMRAAIAELRETLRPVAPDALPEVLP